MQTARHNNHFLLSSKNQGFALMTELASLVIFGFGMLALSTLSEKTVSASSESLQRTHASWMVNSLISRMSMNVEEARKLAYTKNKVNCNNANPNDRTVADLNSIFCKGANTGEQGMAQTKPIDVMGDVDWEITCTDSDGSDALACSKNSVFNITVSWEAAGIGTLNSRKSISYDYNL
ncbi:MAG: hypothetical protein VX185_04300 [Pseudomonadota bacterium]|nr:hypothetical protein [Pseudomonadota bacterium]